VRAHPALTNHRPAVRNQVLFDADAPRPRLAFEREVFDVMLAVLRADEIEAIPRRPDLARQLLPIPDKYACHEEGIGAGLDILYLDSRIMRLTRSLMVS